MSNNIIPLKLVDQANALSLYMDSLLGVSEVIVPSVNGQDVNKRSVNGQVVNNQVPSAQVANKQSVTEQVIQESVSTLSSTLASSSQKEADLAFVEKEAPRLDLSLFLPKVPSSEEIDLIEKKEQIQLNKALQQELDKTKKINNLLQGKLEDSLKKIDDFAKTHTELYAPKWAQPSFQIILFNVGNLKLALPLNDLSSIVVWDKKYITQMPGSSEWYLGLIQHQGKNIPVIDTLLQVVPANKVNAFTKKRGVFKNIIIIDNESWGLVCEEIIGIRTLAVDEVKWRSSRTSRKWLLGTVKEHMCALLDTVEFTSMLRTGKDSLVAN